jgi:hypothetical protein
VNIGVAQTGGWNIGVDQKDVTLQPGGIPQPALLTCNTGYWGCGKVYSYLILSILFIEIILFAVL